MTTAAQPARHVEQRVLLENVSWDYYQRTLKELDEQHVRITYDRGRMELMSPSPQHERAKSIIGRMIEIYALERDIRILPLGSVTCQREDLQRGLEPDECYYVTRSLRNPDEMDLDVDPPPDLAIEVDITSGSIKRESVYSALGVPEIWRFDGQRLHVLRRESSGDYRAGERSLAFPELAMGEFARFLDEALAGDQHTALKAFQGWARKRG